MNIKEQMRLTPRAKVLLGILVFILIAPAAYTEVRYWGALWYIRQPNSRSFHDAVRTLDEYRSRGTNHLRRLIWHDNNRVAFQAARLLENRDYTAKTKKEWRRLLIVGHQMEKMPTASDERYIIFKEMLDTYEGTSLSLAFQSARYLVDERIPPLLLPRLQHRLEQMSAFAGLSDQKQAEHLSACYGLIGCLATQGSVEALQLIESFLDHPSQGVRASAIRALCHLRFYPALPSIVKLAEHTDYAIGTAALEALREMPDDRSLPLLIRIIEDEGDRRLIYASDALFSRMDNTVLANALQQQFARVPRDERLQSEGVAVSLLGRHLERDDFRNRIRKAVEISTRRNQQVRRRPSPEKVPLKDFFELVGPERGPAFPGETPLEALNRLAAEIEAGLRQTKLGFNSSQNRGLIRTLTRLEHPAVVPLVLAFNHRCRPSSGYMIGFEFLGRMKVDKGYQLMIAALPVQPRAAQGLASLGDVRAIPALKARLPELSHFRLAAKALVDLGWQPQTQAEKAYALIAQGDPAALDGNKRLLHNFLREQLRSPELRRRELAASAVVGLALEALVPDVVKMLNRHQDGRFAFLMLQSGQPDLEAAAREWIDRAPQNLGLRYHAYPIWGDWMAQDRARASS